MKIERKTQGADRGEVFHVESKLGHSHRPGRKVIRRMTSLVVTALVAAAITFAVVNYTTPERFGLVLTLKAANGKIALSQGQLRDLVVREGLVVYWLGPEKGVRYALVSVNKNQNYVRYLPDGQGLNDVGANFRVVGTYKAKDAFLTTQIKSTQLTAGSAGFTNADGDAVYYNTITNPLSAYVGLRNADYQVEIFDPIRGQAITQARTVGLIQKIG